MKLNFKWNPFAAKQAVEQAGMTIAKKTAEYMADRARLHCPVDTGALVASIQIIDTKAGQKIHVVATEYYAPWVEFGHMNGSTWVAPQPFMRTALADTVSAFGQIAKGVTLQSPLGGAAQNLGASFDKK